MSRRVKLYTGFGDSFTYVRNEEGTLMKCMIEGLQQSVGVKDDPKWEVLPPDGYHFIQPGYEPLHGLICFSEKDLQERTTLSHLQTCNPDTCSHPNGCF